MISGAKAGGIARRKSRGSQRGIRARERVYRASAGTLTPAGEPIGLIETVRHSAQTSRVLVVEDNMDAADMFVMTLQMFGHEVQGLTLVRPL